MEESAKLVSLGMPTQLALEVARQIADGANAPNLVRLGVPTQLAKELAWQIANGADVENLASLGMPTQLAAEVARQIAEGGSFNPASLFLSNEAGEYFPVSASAFFSDTAATIPATADGIVRGWKGEKYGVIATAAEASAPSYRIDGEGQPYLDFSGGSKFMSTAAVNFSASTQISVAVRARKLSDAAGGVIAELTNGATVGRFTLSAPSSTTSILYSMNFNAGTSKSISVTDTAYAATHDAVIVGTSNLATPLHTLTINGTKRTEPTTAGAGPYANAPIFIGMRNGASLPFNGRIYKGLLVIGRELSDVEAASVAAGFGGANTATLLSVAALPDSTLTPSGGNGFTCTGMTRLSDSTWIVVNYGRNASGTPTFVPGFVRLSADFSTVLANIDMSVTYGTTAGLQGVAADASDNLWFADQIGNNIRKCNLSGALIGTPISLAYTPNGVAYDALLDEVFVGEGTGSLAVRVYDGTAGTIKRTISVPAAPDQLYHDGKYLWLTSGANGATADLIACGPTGARIGTFALPSSEAVEGCLVDRAAGRAWICNDGFYHEEATINLNAVMTYRIETLL